MYLNDLLRLNGQPFIAAAYLAILKRQVDPAGMDHFMERLALGDGKEGVIFALATSSEAADSRIDVIGLKQLLRRQSKSHWRRFIPWLVGVTLVQRQVARVEHMIALQHQQLLAECSHFKEVLGYAEIPLSADNQGWSDIPVRETLRELQNELANTVHNPEIMLERFERVIRSSVFPSMLR
jgi:hypothetical protein